MPIDERSSALGPDRTQVEHAIEQLYAVGLELQASTDRADVSRCVSAVVPGCVQCIAELMTELRGVAGYRSASEVS